MKNEPDNGRLDVLAAAKAMLRPIARMLIRSGIVHRDLVALTREVYVDVARSEFGLRGRQTSISRTALLTGLARKEVRRIANRLEGDYTGFEPSNQDRITRVLSGWHHDADYTDAAGQPLAIPVAGPAPSFADLKRRYGGDVPASAMLRELVNAGTVSRDDQDLLRPIERYFMPHPTDREHVLRAGSVVADVGATVTRNLYRGERDPSWFERRAANTNMSPAQVEAFRTFVAQEGQQFLERVDDWLSRHESTSDNDQPVRLGLGMYIIKDDPDKDH
ncbi:MAG: hypothetical protein HKN49_05105 [Gammaproteobacteria bacterium]|nr:hypothetical protein [Gammaproteobacteria bacterium]